MIKDKPGFFDNNILEDDWPQDIKMVWKELIVKLKEAEHEMVQIRENVKRGTLHGPDQNNLLTISNDEFSCWNLYRKKLVERHFSNIDAIQEECFSALRYLNGDTSDRAPVKGLIVGYVQSGKTANMAGLMSMAADCGWNIFIVLSGTINSLRDQTQKRLYGDLNDSNCKHYWQTYDHLSPSNRDADPRQLKLEGSSPVRYLSVCLKNKKGLTDLLKWLNLDEKKKAQMKILLIDDEADQASINTAKPDKNRTAINDLIIKIVEGKTADNKPRNPCGAMNYVSYTATPYANFLSEGSFESLYPRDFVSLLSPSNLYLGPVQLYGLDEKDRDPMGIVDTDENTEEVIRPIHSGNSRVPPYGMKKAISWFICCVAILRKRGFKTPVSMLIHTSAITDEHRNVAEAVYQHLTASRNEALDTCELIYTKEIKRFKKEDFFDRCKEYGRSPESVDDYPPYEDIVDEVEKILNIKPTHIMIDYDEGTFVYSEGINLCIDNSKYETLDEADDEEKMMPRLIYPDPEKPESYPDFATAFIVVGGNTMSRGLTIEGLVSTYFARPISQGDTLMQMGRWFGYRKGYELLPRMWMSKASYDSFRVLVDVDESLRDFIRDNYSVISPKDLPAKIKCFPKNTYLKEITASNKRRGSSEVGFNFEGIHTQTTSFDKNPLYLEDDISIATEFLSSLGNGYVRSEVCSALVWHGIPGKDVFEKFLNKIKFSKRQKNFNELSEMKRWIQLRGEYAWNIILPDVTKDNPDIWKISDAISVAKVDRKARSEDNNFLQLRMLSTVNHRYADIKEAKFHNEDFTLKELKKDNGKKWREIRTSCDCNNIPALIIYCVSKNYRDENGDLLIHTEKDIMAISVIMPGVSQSNENARFLQISPEITRGDE